MSENRPVIPQQDFDLGKNDPARTFVDDLRALLAAKPYHAERITDWSARSQTVAADIVYKRLEVLPTEVLAPAIDATLAALAPPPTDEATDTRTPAERDAYSFLHRITTLSYLDPSEEQLRARYEKSNGNA
jgi:hypothetical protein